MLKKPKVKRRIIRERINEISVDVFEHLEKDDIELISNSLDVLLQKLSPNRQTTEGDFTGPITTWITHTDIDESNIQVNNISGGDIRIRFQESIWNKWKNVQPHDLVAGSGGRINSDREVDSNYYDGDHRLKIECSDNVTYSLRFFSVDR